jgi:methyl-accepting chemotaxis protein
MIAFAVFVSFALSLGLYFITPASTQMPEPNEAYIFEPWWGISLLKVTLIFCFLLTLLAWISLRMSHRIAGPIYRFERVVKSVIAGDYDTTAIRLRKGDEFQELADDLNEMMDVLRARREEARDIVQKLSQKLAQTHDGKVGGANAYAIQSKQYLAQMQKARSELMKLSK